MLSRSFCDRFDHSQSDRLIHSEKSLCFLNLSLFVCVELKFRGLTDNFQRPLQLRFISDVPSSWMLTPGSLPPSCPVRVIGKGFQSLLCHPDIAVKLCSCACGCFPFFNLCLEFKCKFCLGFYIYCCYL